MLGESVVVCVDRRGVSCRWWPLGVPVGVPVVGGGVCRRLVRSRSVVVSCGAVLFSRSYEWDGGWPVTYI